MKTDTAGADRVTLGLGTNLGDRAENLRGALRELSRIVRVEALSNVYESEPFGFSRQPVFWNMAVRVRTSMQPRDLLDALQQTETRIGRRRTFRMGPRVLDIDVLLWEDRVIRENGLTVPHPGVLDRSFVLRPLLDLEPDALHPVTRRRLDGYLDSLSAQGLKQIGPAADVLGKWDD